MRSRTKATRASIAVALALAAPLLGSGDALAYCRSTTCVGDCPRDEFGCKTAGLPLYWAGLCVGFSLQQDGSVNLPLETAYPAIKAAFVAWSDLECDAGGNSTLSFAELPHVACHQTEYVEDGPNANIIMFQDNKWAYTDTDNTLAKTTVTYDEGTGEILDADIEINHANNNFTVTDDNVVYDLQAILTHEVGHFIGFDHTPAEVDAGATMFAGYEVGTTDLRSLEPDDVLAACSVYPPGRAGTCNPEPPGGLADACGGLPAGEEEGGCAVRPGSPRSYGGAALALGAAAALMTSRRRRANLASKKRNRVKSAHLFAFLSLGVALWAACEPGGSDAEDTLCVPESLVFCRCRGNDAGTKQCNEDGDAFDECLADATGQPCEEVVPPTDSGTGTGTSDTGTPTDTSTTSTSTGMTGSGALFAACAAGTECQSGVCHMGLCSKGCGTYQDCVDGSTQGECIHFVEQALTICVPYCNTVNDCQSVYGEASLCSYAVAPDGFGATVCGDWGESVTMPPVGTECDGDVKCHLNYAGVERVCIVGFCAEGCYEDIDCPNPEECSSNGATPGNCF